MRLNQEFVSFKETMAEVELTNDITLSELNEFYEKNKHWIRGIRLNQKGKRED